MSQRLASCSCGQLTAQVVGEPVRVSICHCLACQRRTGSVFGQQARFRRENVSLSGTSSEYVRVGDEGSRVRFHFCPNCGSTVYYEPDRRGWRQTTGAGRPVSIHPRAFAHLACAKAYRTDTQGDDYDDLARARTAELDEHRRQQEQTNQTTKEGTTS